MKTIPLFSALTLISLVFFPKAQAVSPPPDGGYPGGNTAEGQNALLSLTTGGFNTAVGFLALSSDTAGPFNTAIGSGALLANDTERNTAIGAGALLSNTTGSVNTATGAFALLRNTNGSFNTAVGDSALYANTNGQENTAVGFGALSNNPPGNFNTAVGSDALLNTMGGGNTAIGAHALQANSTGNANTAVGNNALLSSTGGGNIALGLNAGSGVSTADNVTAIGSAGANVSGCFIGRIRGVTTAQNNAIPVLIDSAGQLGTMSSSRRFKSEIKPMDKASEAILALKPVTFHYKSDAKNRPEFGLIAEQVAQVNPDLVVRDENGEIYTVRYDAVNAMLLNEFLKEHCKVEEQQATIAELKSESQTVSARQQREIQTLTARLEQQAAQIQKVSAQLEMMGPATKVAVNQP